MQGGVRRLRRLPRLVVRLRRVRLADRVAMSFDETYLPRDLGEKVEENDLEAEPVFALLENKYTWSHVLSWRNNSADNRGMPNQKCAGCRAWRII
jgi:DNA-binding GntR family transcriptional regulator